MFSRLLGIVPIANRKQRVWIALAVGGIFAVLTVGVLLVMSVLHTKEWPSPGSFIVILCLVSPFVLIVTVGTFTQLAYQGMFVRWGKRMRDANRATSDAEHVD